MNDKKNPDLQGEGNYDAARKYQQEQHEFAKSDKVKDAARDAAEAVDSADEGAELEQARKDSAKGKTGAEKTNKD